MAVDRDSSSYWDWPGWTVGDGDEPMLVRQSSTDLRCASGGSLGSTAQAAPPPRSFDSTKRPQAAASDSRQPRRRRSPDKHDGSSQGPGHLGAHVGGGGPGIPDPSLGGPGDLGGNDPRHDTKSTPNGRRGDPGVIDGVKSVLAQLEQALTKLDASAAADGASGDPSRKGTSTTRGRDPGHGADGGGRNPTPLPTPRGSQQRDAGNPQRQGGSMTRGQRKPSRPQSASAGSRYTGSKTNPAAARTPRRRSDHEADRARAGNQTWRPAQTWD